ncbi:MAG: hypothetical protein KIS67_23145 [Verrucomicrobiae bacterium]|nr:hypothetical protein [Verrucomicrobiae bacterium]
MNILEDIRQLRTDAGVLRKFGLVVGGVLTGLGLLFLWRHKLYYPYFLWPGVVLVFFGAVWPRALKWVYLVWMSAAFVLGFAMAHVILTLLFFVIITPVGLVARLAGKDFLRLKLNRVAKSYWLPREQRVKPPADYEKQY